VGRELRMQPNWIILSDQQVRSAIEEELAKKGFNAHPGRQSGPADRITNSLLTRKKRVLLL